MGSHSHYTVLGLERGAATPDIRKAYFSLARLYHPDKNGGVESGKYLLVKEAYETLSDDDKRKVYDQSLSKAPIQIGIDEQRLCQHQKKQVEAMFRTAKAEIESEMRIAEELHRKKMEAIQSAGEEQRRAMGSSHEKGIAELKRLEALKQQQHEKDLRASEAKAARLVEANRLAREEAERVEAAKVQAQRGAYAHGGSSAHSYSSSAGGGAYGYAPPYEKKEIPASDLSREVAALKAMVQQFEQTLSVLQSRQAAFQTEMMARQDQSQRDVANRLSYLEATVFRRH